MIFRRSLLSKAVSWLLLLMFFVTDTISFSPAYAQSVLDLPAPGAMVNQSDAFVPVMLRAVKLHIDQPLVFDFIIDTGNTKASPEDIARESEKIAKYFLASLTIPEKDLWVNLSPYENDRIIPEALGQTEMGRDLLAQDYILKQLSASLVHPDKDLGKAFWSRVYERAKAELGTTDIPASTFNKVWIVPDKAVVYENKDTAIVGESHFKVMLEQDYLALKNNLDNTVLATDTVTDETVDQVSKLSSDIVRDIVIPELEREVNTGKNFALLRQIQNALILATWYKENLKESLLAQVYADQRKVAGVDVADKTIKDQIYEQYIAAYREGVFNLIREDQDPMTQEILPRKYFSGGYEGDVIEELVREQRQPIQRVTERETNATPGGDLAMVTIGVRDAAMQRPVQRNTYQASAAVRADLLTAQNIPNLAFDVAKLLGKSLKLKNKDITEGVTFSKTGNAVTIFFNDDTSLEYEIADQNVVVATEHPESMAAVDLLGNMLTKSSRFAGNGYSQPVSFEAIQNTIANKPTSPTTTYAREVEVASRAAGLSVTPEVVVVDTGAQETFGSIYLGGKMIVERAFVQRIEKSGNPADMLTRAFIFTFSTGTWMDKKQKEFEWARQNAAAALQSNPNVNALLEMETALLGEVNRELLQNQQLPEATRIRMAQVMDDVEQRIKSAVASLGVAMLNNEMQSGRHIFYPLAADPLHFGQFEALLRLMVTAKSTDGVFRLQGPDFRKILTLFTAPHRVGMMDKFLGNTSFKPYFTMPHNMIGSVDGETQIIEYLIQNVDEPGIFEALYLVGTDHMHLNAPDKVLDATGLPLPKKLADGSNQPDTIRKLLEQITEKLQAMQRSETNPERGEKITRVITRLQEGTMKVIPSFNERSPLDSVPVSGEAGALQEVLNQGKIMMVLGSNIPAASSTAIRNALAGIGDEWALALLPKTVLQDIMTNDQYRGWAIKLSDTIRNIAAGKSTAEDILVLKNWVDRAKQNGTFNNIDVNNREALAEAVSRMFTLAPEEIPDVVKQDKEFQKVFKWEDVTLAKEITLQALQAIDFAEARLPELKTEVARVLNATEQEEALRGGIDLNATLGSMQVERTGERVKVTVDPALIERIKTQGVQGFKPVIINIMPITSMFPALGLNDATPSDKALARASG